MRQSRPEIDDPPAPAALETVQARLLTDHSIVSELEHNAPVLVVEGDLDAGLGAVRVRCLPDDDGVLFFWWDYSAAETELRPIAPAGEIGDTVALIIRERKARR